MKTKILMAVMIAGMIWAGTGFAGPEHMQAPGPGSEEFERVKSLAGTWKGTSNTDGKTEEAVVEYKLTSGGSAVAETLFPGTPHEMISIYHDDEDGKLAMTHYCALGNQPKLGLKRYRGNTIELELLPKSELAKKPHMHALSLDFPAAGELIQTWTYFENGKPGHSTTITVKKV